ncbi:hypothetical protein DH2020_030385 [Rehmannia glutinosa]|uniref:Legume lectin domain-containing protein n=1 Tax=Rehmannia glutinosa TaxID=99300 RepID=A0ABR0VL10_REHGL
MSDFIPNWITLGQLYDNINKKTKRTHLQFPHIWFVGRESMTLRTIVTALIRPLFHLPRMSFLPTPQYASLFYLSNNKPHPINFTRSGDLLWTMSLKADPKVLLSAIHFSLSLPSKPHFGSNLVLIGDAKFANNSSCIRLTNPTISSPSSGFLIQKKPIKLFSSNSKSRKPVSFSTDFSFSISPHNGDGLAFLVVPKNFISKFSTENFGVLKENRFLGVEFDTSADENVGDVNANHVGVDVGSLVSVKTSNVSSINLVLNSGVKLHSWVDYDSSSKRIEIRLGKFGSARPYNPLLVYQVDLGEMWRNEEVLVGLSSSSGKSMQISNVYSWNFRTRTVPKWLHSQPMDPRAFSSKHSEEKLAQKKKICALGFLSGLVFMTGCGALLALVVLFLWALFENSSETVLTIPGKCTVHSGDFRYEKINVVVGDNPTDDAKN